jgi:3-dehydroquinate synthase
LIDPDVLATLPAREYRAGLYEVVKHGVIRSPWLFDRMLNESEAVLRQDPEIVEAMIAESVRIKAEVVTEDEKEGDLRRILNYGHTIGHALEAETKYSRLLHGEAVAFGMRAAAHLGRLAGITPPSDAAKIVESMDVYGKLPSIADIRPESLTARVGSDKKTIKGKVHFVLADRIGSVVIRNDIDPDLVHEATATALAELAAA